MIKPINIKSMAVARKRKVCNRGFWLAYRFFSAKGYVISVFPPSFSYRKKIKVIDVIWAAENIEQRFYEILPAAVIRFPGHFDKPENWPTEFREVIRSLKTNEANEFFYKGISSKKLQKWCEFKPVDRRAKRLNSSRYTFRLDGATTNRLKSYAARRQITLTDAVHIAIEHLPEN